MTLEALLQTCAAQHVLLWAEKGTVQYRAPRGAVTLALRQALVAHKPELLVWLHKQDELFNERAAIMQYDGGLSLEEAEWQAFLCVMQQDSQQNAETPTMTLPPGGAQSDEPREPLENLSTKSMGYEKCSRGSSELLETMRQHKQNQQVALEALEAHPSSAARRCPTCQRVTEKANDGRLYCCRCVAYVS